MMKSFEGKAGLLPVLALLCQPAAAETVYKCVEGGKTRFSSAPPQAGGGCQSMELQAPPPGAEAAARQGQKQRREEAVAQDARIRELIQNDPDAARRAQSAKTAESLARQPVVMPSWGGGRGKKGGGYK